MAGHAQQEAIGALLLWTVEVGGIQYRAMKALWGMLGLLVVFGALGAAYFGCRVLAARALGVGSLRPFDLVKSGPWWRTLAARVGAVAGLLLFIGTANVVSLSMLGKAVPTTRVQVLWGPAADAGMRDGDRVLEVDGHPVDAWESVDAALRRPAASHHVLLERNGRVIQVRVAPDAAGRVYLRSLYGRRPYPIEEALLESARLPFASMAATLRAAISHSQPAPLEGPLGMSVAADQPGPRERIGRALALLAVMGSHSWFGVVLLETVDALSRR